MRIVGMTALAALALCASAVFAQDAPEAPKDKATYFANPDLNKIWANELAKQIREKRILSGGGGAYTINVRIVRESDPPLIHGKTLDIWIVKSGSATAITGGTMTNKKPNGNTPGDFSGTQTGGVEQPLKVGDILYVPPGLPHGFKDIKNFEALLVRFDTK